MLMSDKQEDFEQWMAELHGSIICNCGHGCRQWVQDNGPKAYKIIQALVTALGDKTDLDKIVQKEDNEVLKEIWDENMKRVREER